MRDSVPASVDMNLAQESKVPETPAGTNLARGIIGLEGLEHIDPTLLQPDDNMDPEEDELELAIDGDAIFADIMGIAVAASSGTASVPDPTIQQTSDVTITTGEVSASQVPAEVIAAAAPSEEAIITGEVGEVNVSQVPADINSEIVTIPASTHTYSNTTEVAAEAIATAAPSEEAVPAADRVRPKPCPTGRAALEARAKDEAAAAAAVAATITEVTSENGPPAKTQPAPAPAPAPTAKRPRASTSTEQESLIVDGRRKRTKTEFGKRHAQEIADQQEKKATGGRGKRKKIEAKVNTGSRKKTSKGKK